MSKAVDILKLVEDRGEVTLERKKYAERYIKISKLTDKIISVDDKGIKHTYGFIDWNKIPDLIPLHLRDIIRLATNMYIAKTGKMPPGTFDTELDF